MESALVAELLKLGLAGVVIVGLTAALVWQTRAKERVERERVEGERRCAKELGDLHAARVADSQAVTTKLVAITSETVAVLTSAAAAMEAQTESAAKFERAMRDLGERVERAERRPSR